MGRPAPTAGRAAATGSASPAPLFVPRPPGKEPAPAPPAECGAFQLFPCRPPPVSRLAFPAKSGRRGKRAPRPAIDRVENFPAGSTARGKKEALLAAVACQFFLLRVRRVESLRPGAVAHSNFGPKRASNSRRIYSSNKINIRSRPFGLTRRLDFLREGDGLWGVEESGGCYAESIPSLMSAPGVM